MTGRPAGSAVTGPDGITIKISRKIHGRLIERQAGRRAAAGRYITLTEVIEELLDKAETVDRAWKGTEER